MLWRCEGDCVGHAVLIDSDWFDQPNDFLHAYFAACTPGRQLRLHPVGGGLAGDDGNSRDTAGQQ